MAGRSLLSPLFFFNDTATTEIYTLSLHDALPISHRACDLRRRLQTGKRAASCKSIPDRKSTRLNSSHSQISYAVFCLKKKKPHHTRPPPAPTEGARRRRIPTPPTRAARLGDTRVF